MNAILDDPMAALLWLFVLPLSVVGVFCLLWNRRLRRENQVRAVRARLLPHRILHRVRVQLDSNGAIVELRSRVPLQVGMAVEVAASDGLVQQLGKTGRMVGIVIESEALL